MREIGRKRYRDINRTGNKLVVMGSEEAKEARDVT